MTIQLRNAAKHHKELPHQMAAWDWLQEQLSAEVLKQFTEMYRADPLPKQTLPPAWLAPALKIIKKWEGCRLDAYLCPAGVPTIGYGSTRLIDGPVRMGDKITQKMADEMLQNEVEHLFAPGVFTLLPMAKKWRGEQQAAIISFAYNVGLGALEESTLRKRLLAGEDINKAVIEELPKWVKANGRPLEGLINRRKDEVRLFTGGQPLQQEPLRGNPINAPWFSQLDSTTDQARRMCFSSSCAMLLATVKPGAITGPNADDQYLQRVQQYGDTTDPAAQVKALASYGIKARFVQSASFKTIEQQIDRGIPVPCGYLHRGPVTAPSGGGHWLCVVGYTADHMVVHDPLGESDLITGATLNTTARFARYSRKNWGPRWMVEGNGTGWAIIAD